ncbi:MAG: hypothetical protein U1E73_06195 [Planctomycetota bacterium]
MPLLIGIIVVGLPLFAITAARGVIGNWFASGQFGAAPPSHGVRPAADGARALLPRPGRVPGDAGARCSATRAAASRVSAPKGRRPATTRPACPGRRTSVAIARARGGRLAAVEHPHRHAVPDRHLVVGDPRAEQAPGRCLLGFLAGEGLFGVLLLAFQASSPTRGSIA